MRIQNPDRGERLRSFGAQTNLIVNVVPARDHALLVVFKNHAEARVAEFDERFTILLAQPVLHVGRDGVTT